MLLNYRINKIELSFDSLLQVILIKMKMRILFKSLRFFSSMQFSYKSENIKIPIISQK
jgi:hypothetical protein